MRTNFSFSDSLTFESYPFYDSWKQISRFLMLHKPVDKPSFLITLGYINQSIWSDQLTSHMCYLRWTESDVRDWASLSCQVKHNTSNTKEAVGAPHSSTLAWKIPRMEKPGRLQSMGSLSQTLLSNFTLTFHFHALEKEMATHSSVLAWRIPGTAEPGGLPSVGSHRVGHDWRNLAAAAETG